MNKNMPISLLLLLLIVPPYLNACDCMIASNNQCPVAEYEQTNKINPIDTIMFGEHNPTITPEQVSATPRHSVEVDKNSYHRLLHATLDCIDKRIETIKNNIEPHSGIFAGLKFVGCKVLAQLGINTWDAIYTDQWHDHVNAFNVLRGTRNRLLKNYNRHSDQYLAKILMNTQYNQDGSVHTIKDCINPHEHSAHTFVYNEVKLPREVVKDILPMVNTMRNSCTFRSVILLPVINGHALQKKKRINIWSKAYVFLY